MEKVFVFLADGFETVEALAIVDILRRAKIDVYTVSINDQLEVISSQNIKVTADKTIDEIDFEQGAMLFLPGGLPGTTNLAECKELERQIIEYNMQGKKIAAICAAPSILGNLGLLKGKKAACYPGWEDKLKGADVGGRVVIDGNIATGIGMGAAVEMGLELVGILAGGELKEQIKGAIQF